MSLTVACKTSSGIARQRLPPAQFAPGPPAAILRIGLINGSRRPFCPIGLCGGFFSATTAAVSLPVALVGLAFVAGFAGAGVDGFVATTGAAFLLAALPVAGVAPFVVPVLTAGVAVALAAAPAFCVLRVPVATAGLAG